MDYFLLFVSSGRYKNSNLKSSNLFSSISSLSAIVKLFKLGHNKLRCSINLPLFCNYIQLEKVTKNKTKTSLCLLASSFTKPIEDQYSIFLQCLGLSRYKCHIWEMHLNGMEDQSKYTL